MKPADTDAELAAAAEKLKIRGNELYMQHEHEAAYKVYSDAIEKAPTNPILWANRAATCIARQDYIQAAYDCEEAVALEPPYTKAWGRLAIATQALEAWPRCIQAWERAIDCLPQDKASDTPTQKAQRSQFEEGLKKARDMMEAPAGEAVEIKLEDVGRTPWMRAEALLPEVTQRGRLSSVFSMADAYADWKEGVGALNKQKVTRDAQGNERISGDGALESLTNAILSDGRVWHIMQGDFFDKLDYQTRFENGCLNGYASRSISTMKQEVVKRLKAEGWDSLRHAIGVTIRTWIMSGYIQYRGLSNRIVAHALLSQSIDFLEWGQKRWTDVSTEKRGVVFLRSFVRGIKLMRLNNMFGAVCDSKGSGELVSISELLEAAEDLVVDVDSDPKPPGLILHQHGHHISFWLRPKATALSIIGWVALQSARSQLPSKDNITEFREASDYYMQAAEAIPSDDEDHAQYLAAALDCLVEAGAPLRETLPLAKRLQDAIPPILRVWEMSGIGGLLPAWSQELKAFVAESSNKSLDETTILSSLVRGRKADVPNTKSIKIERKKT